MPNKTIESAPTLVKGKQLVAPLGPLPITLRCLQMLAKSGKVPSYRIGKTILFDKDEVMGSIRQKGGRK